MERYGTIPKRFTKEWWSYFWYYYKWHVLGTLFALFFIVFTCVQCATRPKYDTMVTYAGSKVYDDAALNALASLAGQDFPDIDGNGKVLVGVQQMNFSNNASTAEYDYAIQTKLDLTLQDGETLLYLYDKATAELMLGREYADQIYAPLSQWCANPKQGEQLMIGTEGYAISLSGSKLLEENQIYHEDLYLVVRTPKDQNEKTLAAYNASIAFANKLVSNQ